MWCAYLVVVGAFPFKGLEHVRYLLLRLWCLLTPSTVSPLEVVAFLGGMMLIGVYVEVLLRELGRM